MYVVRCFPLFTGFAVLYFVLACVQGRKGSVKINPDSPGINNGICVAVNNQSSALKLKCASGDVIYTINISSYNSTRCEDVPGVCKGLQPTVFTDSHLCYSRRICYIRYNNRNPIVKTTNASCIGKTPSVLKASYRCVKKDIFFALHRTEYNKTFSTEMESDYGMLVSHDTYPWHYEKDLRINVTLKPKNKNRTRLYISVPVLEIDHDMDILRITDYSRSESGKNININKTAEGKAILVTPSVVPETLIKFYTDADSYTAKGFIVCYYWTNDDLSNTDICSMLKKKDKKKKRKRKKKRKGDRKMKKKEKKGKKKGKKRKPGKGGKKRKSRKKVKQRRNLRT